MTKTFSRGEFKAKMCSWCMNMNWYLEGNEPFVCRKCERKL